MERRRLSAPSASSCSLAPTSRRVVRTLAAAVVRSRPRDRGSRSASPAASARRRAQVDDIVLDRDVLAIGEVVGDRRRHPRPVAAECLRLQLDDLRPAPGRAAVGRPGADRGAQGGAAAAAAPRQIAQRGGRPVRSASRRVRRRADRARRRTSGRRQSRRRCRRRAASQSSSDRSRALPGWLPSPPGPPRLPPPCRPGRRPPAAASPPPWRVRRRLRAGPGRAGRGRGVISATRSPAAGESERGQHHRNCSELHPRQATDVRFRRRRFLRSRPVLTAATLAARS